MTKLHADASPSSSGIWIACPASVTKARGRQRVPTIYTLEGSVAHAVAEERLNAGKKYKWPGIYEMDGQLIDVTEEMKEAIEVYAKHVEKLKAVKRYEQKVSIDYEGEALFGTADTVAVNGPEGWVEVVDFKYGQGVRVSADSSQLKIYGLGVLNNLGPFEDIRTIDLTVVQPRIDPDNPTNTVSLRISEIEKWGHDILTPALDRLAAGDLTETTGDHCRWCVRAGECQALADLAMTNAQTAFGAIPPAPASMTDDELGLLLDHAQMIVDWVSKVKAEATGRIEKGSYVPGWKLVAKRAMRRWAKPSEAITHLMQRGVDPMSIMRIETIGNVEAAMKRNRVPLKTLDQFTAKESSGSTLVSEKDGRPAVDNSVQNVFGDVID